MSLINKEDLMQTLGITNMDCEKCEWYSRTARMCKRGSDFEDACIAIDYAPEVKPEPKWIPCSERFPSEEERKEWIDKNLDGIGYLYPCLVTRYSSINPDRTKNNPYVAKHYFDGEDFLNAGEKVCTEYIIAWMPLPEPYREEGD